MAAHSTTTTIEDASDLPQPHDHQVEADLISGCLQGAEHADTALQVVEPDDFYFEHHRTIFAVIKRLRTQGLEADQVSVTAELRRINAPDLLGLPAALLVSWIPVGREVSRRAAQVKQLATLRQIIELAGELQTQAAGQPDNPAAVIDAAMAGLTAAREAWRPPQPAPLRTFADLDLLPPPTWAWPGWLANGHVSMLFGPPGAGKSYVALSLCGPVTQGTPWPDGQDGPGELSTALLLDFEMTQRATLERAKEMNLPLHMLLTQPEEVVPYLNRPDSIGVIRGWLEETRARILIIDSLRDALPGTEENDAGGMAGALHPLKILADEFDIPILLLHHCRKGQVSNGSERWELSMDDLRGSSAIAGAVRTIMAIDKPAADRQTRRLKIVKSNFAAFPEALGFDVAADGLRWTTAPFAGRDMPQRCAAEEAIRIALQRQPKRFGELQKILEAQGISRMTMTRALKEVAVKTDSGLWGLRTPD